MRCFTSKKTRLLTAALGLLLACGGGAREQQGEVSQERLDLRSLPEWCELDKACGDLVGVNCRQEVDGPYYYVEASTGRIVETCGGACMLGPRPEQGWCVECPPRQWTCD